MSDSIYGDALGGAASGAATGSVIPGVGTAIGAGVGLLSGLFKYGQSEKALKDLANTPYPNYTLSPQLQDAYNRSLQMAQHGFSGSETAAFKQNLAQNSNLAYQRGISLGGGGMSQALNAGINATKLQSLNQFAGQDAALHRQNIKYSDTLAQALQHQQNLASQTDISRRNALEQTYGLAAQQQNQNVLNSVRSLGSLADRAGVFGGGGQPNYTPLLNMFRSGGSGTPQAGDNSPYPISTPDAGTVGGYNSANQLSLPPLSQSIYGN